MRLLGMVSLFVVAFAGILGAQAQGVDPSLENAISSSQAAASKGDASGWGKFVLDDALFFGDGGSIETKAQRMAKVTPNTASAPKISDERYRTYGNVVIRTWRQDISNKGMSRPDRRTAVWVKQNGEWKMANLQITRIE